jgi:(p)ppGpp synthase/HD superfamily hydrolase
MYITYKPKNRLDDFALEFVRCEFSAKKLSDGLPYYFHCETVAVFTEALLPDYSEFAAAVALLHDVYEDLSPVVAQELFNGLESILGDRVALLLDQALVFLTKKSDMSRAEYIQNICEVPAEFEYVKYIKLADLTHNSLIGRFKNSETVEQSLLRISKYQAEYMQIFAALR